MKQNVIETIIGFAVIILALVFLTYAYNKSNSAKFENGYIVTARFQNAEGIVSGSDIMLAGIKIGFVEKILLDKNSFLAIAFLKINNDIKLPKDSQAIISSNGFLGGKFISISPGGDEENLANNDQIKHTQSSVNIESLIGKLIYSFSSSNKSQ